MRTVIANVTVLDGSGAPSRASDVWLDGGRIDYLATPGRSHGRATVVAGDELVLAPGFIDVHSHADRSPFANEPDTTKLLQGITTEVVGNCGSSPLDDDADPTTYLTALDRAQPVTNLAPLLGHGSLRRRVLGMAGRAPDSQEARTMHAWLEQALDAGAFGLSSGLFYAPGSYADAEELATLLEGFRGRPLVYASHIRNEGNRLVEAVDEFLAVGRRTHVALELSHHKAAGLPNWGRTADTLRHIAAARSDGVVVALDAYPYTASSTSVSANLPGWVLEGGVDAALARLADPATRDLIRQECEDPAPDSAWESMVAATGYDHMVVAWNPADGTGQGQTLAQYARERHLSPFDGLVHLLQESRLAATMVAHSMDEGDLVRVLQDRECWIGTDGVLGSRSARPHPRLTGTFPRVWREFVVKRALLAPEEAIRRMTGGPAAYFSIPERGRVAPGCVADLVLMDPDRLADTSTFDQPWTPPEGVVGVWMAGRRVVADGQYLGTAMGRRLTPGSDR